MFFRTEYLLHVYLEDDKAVGFLFVAAVAGSAEDLEKPIDEALSDEGPDKQRIVLLGVLQSLDVVLLEKVVLLLSLLKRAVKHHDSKAEFADGFVLYGLIESEDVVDHFAPDSHHIVRDVFVVNPVLGPKLLFEVHDAVPEFVDQRSESGYLLFSGGDSPASIGLRLLSSLHL